MDSGAIVARSVVLQAVRSAAARDAADTRPAADQRAAHAAHEAVELGWCRRLAARGFMAFLTSSGAQQRESQQDSIIQPRVVRQRRTTLGTGFDLIHATLKGLHLF